MSEPAVRIPDLWLPWRWPARLLLGTFVAVQALMAITAMVQMDVWLPNIAGVLLLSLAAVLVTRNWGNELPRPVAIAVALIVVGIAAVLGPYGFTTPLRVDDWYVGSAVVIVLTLILWDRQRSAVAAFIAFSAVQWLWSNTVGLPFGDVWPVMLRHTGTIIVTAAIAFGLRRVASQLFVTATMRQEREQQRAVQEAIVAERAVQLMRIDELAGALLRRIETGRPLSEEERRECVLVEATLRDTMSGRGWATDGILAAARSARERGVSVVLVDDSGSGRSAPAEAVEALEHTLRAARGGRCVARLLPADRSACASILIEDADGTARVTEVERPEKS